MPPRRYPEVSISTFAKSVALVRIFGWSRRNVFVHRRKGKREAGQIEERRRKVLYVLHVVVTCSEFDKCGGRVTMHFKLSKEISSFNLNERVSQLINGEGEGRELQRRLS